MIHTNENINFLKFLPLVHCISKLINLGKNFACIPFQENCYCCNHQRTQFEGGQYYSGGYYTEDRKSHQALNTAPKRCEIAVNSANEVSFHEVLNEMTNH